MKNPDVVVEKDGETFKARAVVTEGADRTYLYNKVAEVLPAFKDYQQQVVKNAQAMAKVIISRGYKIVSGGTENHLMLVDMIGKDVSGKQAEEALGKAHITVNKNSVPNDPRKPFVTSGLRIGTPAVTTRGYKEADCVALAEWICDVLDNPNDDNVIAGVARFPLASEQRPSTADSARPPATSSAWTRFATEALQDLRDLLRIRVAETREVPLLAPEQSYFLRENLRLKLLSARLALLARDESAFRADLRTAAEWLDQYFDASVKPVIAATSAIGTAGFASSRRASASLQSRRYSWNVAPKAALNSRLKRCADIPQSPATVPSAIGEPRFRETCDNAGSSGRSVRTGRYRASLGMRVAAAATLLVPCRRLASSACPSCSMQRETSSSTSGFTR